MRWLCPGSDTNTSGPRALSHNKSAWLRSCCRGASHLVVVVVGVGVGVGMVVVVMACVWKMKTRGRMSL